VIRALSRLDPRDLARLVRTAGLVKYVMAGAGVEALSRRDQRRVLDLRNAIGALPPGFEQQARRDLQRASQTRRHLASRLGLIGLARLLDAVEPYRVRWALQHIPYAAAKFTRSLMNPRSGPDAKLVSCESQVLHLAWERLREEGYLREPTGDRT
jgi:hypothetical protein